MSIVIAADSAANLPEDFIARERIPVIAYPCFVGEEPFPTENFDGGSFYDRMRQGMPVRTAQINPQQYEEFFEPMLRRGEDVLFTGMSSGLSGSFQSALLAARALRERYPHRLLELIDTRGASLGEGLVTMKAAELRGRGLSFGEIARELRSMVERVAQIFTVDDLRYLRRGGRLSNAAAVIGTVLQIKPILKGNEEGKIVATAKVRGWKKAVQSLAERYDQLVRNASLQTVGIAHADDEESAALLARLLRRNHPPQKIVTVMYEPVTGSHVGPGTLALFFEGDEIVRSR